MKALPEIHLPDGLEIDIDEGWQKLITRQFTGGPGRGFPELIANMIDSYTPDTDFADRVATIDTDLQSIVITDWGEGLSAERIGYLTTLGGTSKEDDSSTIGTCCGDRAGLTLKTKTKSVC